MPGPVVLITPEAMLHKPAPYVDILENAGCEVRYPTTPDLPRGVCSERETIDYLKGISAIIASAELFTPEVISALPELRVIARSGVGYDRVNVEAATRHGVAVTITPTANHEAVAELALALIFGVAKRIVQGDHAVRTGQWPRIPLAPLRTRTLGIFGLGRIGRSLAVRALGLKMNVVVTESDPDQKFIAEHGIELVEFDQLLARSDFLSIHCPATDQTKRLFGATVFSKMKPGSVLINTARGQVVVEEDLIAALKSGHLGGAGLDVFEQEPPSTDNPLFQMDNVVVSPHIAGADHLSSERMGIEAAESIVELYRDRWPEQSVVNQELRENWKWSR